MFQTNKNKEQQSNPFVPSKKMKTLQTILVLLLVGFIAMVTSFHKIDTSEEGVVTRFGKYSHTLGEGPHFVFPFGIDQVYTVPVTEIHELEFGFRKERSHFSPAQSKQESLMLTGDLNIATVQWILQYRVINAKKYIFHVRTNQVRTHIRDSSISVMRRVVGDKLVSDVLTTDRVSIAEEARRLTQEVVDTYDMGVQIIRINLQNVTPPDPVKPAFNQINIARQERERMVNQAKEQFNKVIPKAKGRAQQRLIEAEAYAIKTINKAKGDSLKFQETLKAYRVAPEVTKKRLYLETMQELLTKAKRLTIIDSKVRGVLPIFGKDLLENSVTPKKNNN